MKLWLFMLVAVLAACEGTIETAFDEGVIPTDPISIANGQELYELHCLSCHGVEAAGTPTWEGSIARYEPIRDIVQNGRGTMAAVGVTTAESNLIQAYLMSLAFPDWSGLTGVELYATGCASCHGEQAEGTSNGPQLRFKDDPYFEFVTRDGGHADRYDAKMVGYDESRISDAQLDQIMAWVDAFPNATTGEGLFEQFCANCHGGQSVRARTDEELDEEGSIYGVCREGKEDRPLNREYMPGWSADDLSDQEIEMLQDYIDATL